MANKYTEDNSYLLEYLARIEYGEIIAGMELILELRRLREDLLEERYVYDRRDALLRMDFMEHCVRLTKSPFYNQPMKLMPLSEGFIETLYSFKMPETGFDRFKKSTASDCKKKHKVRNTLCNGAI